MEPGQVEVTVRDASNGSPIDGLRVDARRRVGDDLKWAGRAYTDSEGIATFNLDGVDNGVTYVLTARPFAASTVYSDDISHSGPFEFLVGKLTAEVVAGGSETPLPGIRVDIREVLPDGGRKWAGLGTTDANGVVRLDPRGLGDGRVYVLEARSPVDGSRKRSHEIREPGNVTFVVGNGPLRASLIDGITGAPIAGARIVALERRDDGSTKGIVSRWTNDQGIAVFDLDGLGSGRTYFLRAAAFPGTYTYSEDLETAGELTMRAGTLKVEVIEGGSEEPMREVRVWAYEIRPDGSRKYRSSANTDSAGIVRLDLPGLGEGRRYALRARSLVDGSYKFSNELNEPGEKVFPVGNAPLTVRLANHFTDEALAGIRIWARQRFDDGSSRAIYSRTTDADGIAVFDLNDLGDGATYFLSAYPYNGGRVSSKDLTAAGDFEWLVGSLEVTVVDGLNEEPLPGVRVYARERREDGKLTVRAYGTTDDFGMIRFDPPGLGDGATYLLQARSPFDGSRKLSDDIHEPARYKFVVGNRPLEVSLLNAITGDPVTDTKIYAFRIEGEKRVYASNRTTDGEGYAVFDLDGLGDGTNYVLRTAPYNGGHVFSEEIRQGGDLEMRVGSFEVTVVSGANGEILPGQRVWAYRVGPEEKLTYVKSGTTDDQGIIRFDLPGLAEGAPHVLQAYSPTDGKKKRSQVYDEAGQAVFRVGNQALEVHVANGIDGTPVALKRIDAYEVVGEDSLEWRANRETNEAGVAIFDLDRLGEGAVYRLRITPYNGGKVYSDPIDSTGRFDFPVGTLRVVVTSGADGEPLPGLRIDAREVIGDDLEWRAYGTTDDNGVIHFDVPGLKDGRPYVLEARSPIDGSKKRSDEITDVGIFNFEVGNEPLHLIAVNGVTGDPIADLKVTIRELISEEEEKTEWVTSAYTDENGEVSLDVEGLGMDDRMFFIESRPYNGGSVWTPMVPSPGTYTLRYGTIPVTLIDGDNNIPIVDAALYAYEKLPNGDLRWARSGHTNDLGIVHFDLPGISNTLVPGTMMDSDRVFVFKAWNPFGNHHRYYSQFVTDEGPVEFRVRREDEAPLDLDPPEIEITSPVDGATVNDAGFDVSGLAADNATLTEVEVEITDPIAGVTTLLATYDATTLRWTVSVPAGAVTVGQLVTVVATASDQALNQSSAMITVMPITDTLPPQVVISSHTTNANVGSAGFLLSGTATDDIGVTAIQATVDDPTVGQSVANIGVSNTGLWTLAVSATQITEGNVIDITIVASDAAGRTGSATIQLNVIAVDFATRHLVNRITFGMTSDLLLNAEAMGATAFLNQQLDPASIDDSALNALLPNPIVNEDDLQASIMLRAAFSERQLLEVATQFWDNHFNTNLNTHDIVAYEEAENAQFRANALGRFRDLLDASAKSPAMLIYLDQANSVAANPNENYPREVMELHTLKVDGPYTQDDVEALSRILTGWTVQNGTFAFDASIHDFGAKTFLGQDFPAGQGQAEGERALDILAAHPSTANFICEKLAILFISDTPPPSVIARCAGVFLAEEQNANQMGEVFRSLLTSPEFADAATFRSKVKTPLEHIVSLVRVLGASTDGYGLLRPMSDMSMRLFENPVPTGFSETGDDWTSADQALQRTRHANGVARGTTNGISLGLRDFFLAQGQVTADGIVPFAMRLFFHDDYTPLEEQSARDVLTDYGAVTFDINASDAEARLRKMMATIASFPGFQFQ